jgi:beta-lactamase regulating signal transducer with metallopeptidase domain
MTAFPTDALFEALANSVWRGTLLVAVTALALRVFKRTTAAERYCVWFAVLLVTAAAPIVQTLGAWRAASGPSTAQQMGVSAFVDSVPRVLAPDASWAITPISAVPQPLLLAWLVVGLLLMLRLGLRCWSALKLKRDSYEPVGEFAGALTEWEQRLQTSRLSPTRMSERMKSPVAIGWARPAVVLPEDCELRASRDEVELLWRHEQAHLARRDDWTQFVAESVCAALWFHPAVYWIKRELTHERELACDEAVLNSGVEASAYARALGRWAERTALGELPVGAMGIGRSESQIIRRIEMLLSPSRIFRTGGARWTFAAGLATAVGLSALLAVAGPVVIKAQSPVEPVVAVETPVRVEMPVEVEARFEAVVPPVPRVKPTVALMSQAVPVPPVAPVAPVAPTPPAPPSPAAEESQEAMADHQVEGERMERWHEEMQPRIREIQAAAANVHEFVAEHMAPHQQKIHQLASAFADAHAAHAEEIAPFVEEMSRLGQEMGNAASEQLRKEKQARMEDLVAQMEAREPALRQRLELETAKIETAMQPLQDELKRLETVLQQKESELWDAEKELQESLR